MTFYFLLAFAYAVGGVPFGLLLGRFFADTDVRELGSGNIGATNVNRVLGRKLGAATLLTDMLKGVVCVVLARILLGDIVSAAWVGFFAFLGHCFPVYLQFKGGKGVATAFGVAASLTFIPALIALVIWVVVVRISKVSALGSLVACVTLPVTSYYFTGNMTLSFLYGLMVALVVVRHKDNIRRLRQGAENSMTGGK